MKKLLILLFLPLAPFGIKAQPTSRKYVNFHMQKLGGTFSYTSGQKPTRFISNGTMQKPVTAIPTAQFNFSSTISTVTGCTNVYGDPTASPSFTNTGTGWILHMVGSGWIKYDGSFFGGVGNGATTASSDGAFSQASINSNLYTGGAVGSNSSSGYQIEFTNLPAGTYTIEVLGSMQESIFSNGGGSNFEVIFGSGSANVGTVYNANGPSNTTNNNVAQGPGTTQVTTGSYTGTITSGQYIYISLGYAGNSYGTGVLGFINGLIIKKIG